MSLENFGLMQAKLNDVVGELYKVAHSHNHLDQKLNNNIISDPDEIDTIFRNSEVFEKNFSLISFLGESRFNSNGTDWKRRRNITQDSYTTAAREPFSKNIFEIFKQEFDKVEHPTITNMNSAIMQASMSVFLKSLRCTSSPKRFADFIENLRQLLVSLQYHSWIGAPDATLKNLYDQSQFFILKFIDLLEEDEESISLLKFFKERLNCSTKSEAAQELLMNMFAGVETSTASIGWIMNRLGVNQMIQERLYDELKNHRDDASYRNCFINETLRYFPPIPFVVRSLNQDFKLNQKRLSAGQQIVISIVGAHHNNKSWTEPHVFNSARSEFLNNTFNRKAFIPYITGPRTCGGIRIAGLEISSALNILLDRFLFSNPRSDVSFDYALALRPKFDDQFSIIRRQ